MRYGCPFCDYDGPSAIVASGPQVFVIEPLLPVTPGHVLVIPYEHVTDFAASAELAAACMWHAASIASDFGWEAANVIASKGEAATQTVMHLHVHVFPRRADDGLKLPWSP